MPQMEKLAAESATETTIDLEQVTDYRFEVHFHNGNYSDVTIDEPPPLGSGVGPNPARMLAAAIGGCLSSSLYFSSGKAKVPVGPMRTIVRVAIGRNENRRLRVKRVAVEIDAPVSKEMKEAFAPCLDVFEDFCTITASVRAGIPVEVTVNREKTAGSA